jgi:ubiquinone/menaquinone biosynthesis C-methylase UbiE/uncharacterized protein YbaR (Trm112 family)
VNRATVELLRCPTCLRELALDGAEGDSVERGTLACDRGHTFEIAEGVPRLVHPSELLPSDAEFQRKYDVGADEYDQGLRWLFESFRVDPAATRNAMVDLLEVQPGGRVLETACGTGEDSQYILQRIGANGTLYAQDLSIGMLRVARRKLAGGSVEYVQSNASYLPFADEVFDAAFHFGGINTFGEVRRALEEMNRVVRVGGKVVVGDEAVAPWLRRRLYGRILVKANPLYRHRPPLDALPENASEVGIRWILGNAFYVIVFRVGSGPLFVDLDLPIPGKGDSLRSRYYGPRE